MSDELRTFKVWRDREEEWEGEPEPDAVVEARSAEHAADQTVREYEPADLDLLTFIVSDGETYTRVRFAAYWDCVEQHPITLDELQGKE